MVLYLYKIFSDSIQQLLAELNYQSHFGKSWIDLSDFDKLDCDYQYTGINKIIDNLKKIGNVYNAKQIYDMLSIKIDNIIASTKLVDANINITVQDSNLVDQFWNWSRSPLISPKQIIVEYSSPCIPEDLDIKLIIMGESLARFLLCKGHNVQCINHVRDIGTNIGMLIYLIKTEYYDDYPKILDQLSLLYQSAKMKFNDKSTDFADKSRAETYKLQQNDRINLDIWDRICKIAKNKYQTIYKQLNITHLEEKCESFYQPLIPIVIELLTSANLIEIRDNIKIIKIDGYDCTLILENSDNIYTRDIIDLVAIYYRLIIQKVDQIIYINDYNHSLRFEMIFTIAEKMKWTKFKGQAIYLGFTPQIIEHAKYNLGVIENEYLT